MSKKKKFSNTSYGIVAGMYNFFDWLNYGNVSRKSRNYFLDKLPLVPKNPMIVGCGTGDFAAAYIKELNPSSLTINDLSEKMISTTINEISKIHGWNGSLQVIKGDITGCKRERKYDFISINYVLNLFSSKNRIEFIKSVKELMAPDGVVLIADFSRPTNPLFLPFCYLNWCMACLFFWMFSFTKPTALGNIEEEIMAAGLKIQQKKPFLGGLYSAWLCKKIS